MADGLPGEYQGRCRMMGQMRIVGWKRSIICRMAQTVCGRTVAAPVSTAAVQGQGRVS